jgi:hypothetical protein
VDHTVRKKLNEIRRKQLESKEKFWTANTRGSSDDKSQHLVALGGVVAGIIIATIVWLAKSIWVNDGVSIGSADTNGPVQGSAIRQANTQIDQLKGRIEGLTESINRLETKLESVIELSESINEIEMKYAANLLENSPTSAGNGSTPSTSDPRVTDSTDVIQTSFVPTHTVDARLNLRPSNSLDATPIAVLDAGTAVEYIKETDGWYYVNTENHGKGWCSSRYLSPAPIFPPPAGRAVE